MKIFILVLLFGFGTTFAQELNANVTVNFEKLPTVNKDNLQMFAQQIQDYLNNTRFTGERWEGDKIRCTFSIFFQSASDDITYSAQVFVGSQRPIFQNETASPMLTVMDNVWNFVYEKGMSLHFNPNDFHPITSFLDFYAFIIIGLDLDTWDVMGGSQYFSRALHITSMGVNSRFSAGWERGSSAYHKRGLVEDLLNERYRGFREAYFEYHYGLDIYSQNKSIALEKMVKIINMLDSKKGGIDPRSVLLRIFFDAKNGEIVDYLRNYPDKSIFNTLKRIDPQHISKYDEALK